MKVFYCVKMVLSIPLAITASHQNLLGLWFTMQKLAKLEIVYWSRRFFTLLKWCMLQTEKTSVKKAHNRPFSRHIDRFNNV